MSSHRLQKILPLILFCLYAFTSQRGVAWQDSGIHQWRALYCDMDGFFGIACAHPLYIWIGHWFSFLCNLFFSIEVPTALNLMSALWMALTIRIFLRIAGDYVGTKYALLAALTLAMSHMTWWLSTISESYTMALFFIASEAEYLYAIIKGDRRIGSYFSLALISGLGFAVHNQILLGLPIAIAVVLMSLISELRAADATNRPQALFKCIVTVLVAPIIWFIASSFIWGLALTEASYGAGAGEIIKNILCGNYASEVFGSGAVSFKLTLANLAITSLSLLLPCWLIAFTALPNALKKLKASARLTGRDILFIVLFVLHLAFFLHYRIADQSFFILPTLFFGAILTARLLKTSQTVEKAPRAIAIITVAMAIIMPATANLILHIKPIEKRIIQSRNRLLPYRDEIRYFVLPWKHNEASAEKFAYATIETMDKMPYAALYADTTSAPPILLRLAHRKEDWQFYTPWNDTSRLAVFAEANPSATYAITPKEGYCPVEAKQIELIEESKAQLRRGKNPLCIRKLSIKRR